MAENGRMDDTVFTDRLLKNLPSTAVPAALEARILADFDRIAMHRRRPGWLKRLLDRFGERLWPGAPAWQPASILALSLAAGLVVGTFVPSQNLNPVRPPADQVALVWDFDMDLGRDL